MNFKILLTVTASMVMLSGCDQSTAPAKQASDASQQLAAFIDDFVSRQENEEPTKLSAASFAEELQQTKAYLARLRTIDRSTLSIEEHIDWHFAERILRNYDSKLHLRNTTTRPGEVM